MSIIKTISKAPRLRVNPSEHFLVKGLRSAFDMSAIVPIYIHVSNNLDTIEKNVDMEFDIGRATIVYSVDQSNTINLISGWVGNREKGARNG